MTRLNLSYLGYLNISEKTLMLEKVVGKEKRSISNKVNGLSYSDNDCIIGRPE